MLPQSLPQHHPGEQQTKKRTMATERLTDRAIKNSKTKEKEYLLSDGNGLFLRVRPDGTKSWLLIYTFSGKRRKLGLGGFDTMSLKLARERAQQARDELACQIDPQLAKQERETSQEAQRQAEAARITISNLFERWFSAELSRRKDKGAEARRSFEKDILPSLGNIAAEDLKRNMIALLLDSVSARGAPIIARNLLGDLRQMFGYAIKRGFVENDPTSHLKRDDFGKKNERDRVLDEAEIKLLFKKLADAELHDASIASIWIMLSTCCRVGEISQARWEHIDFLAKTWRIPPGNAKNKKEHTISLSDFAISHFHNLQRLVDIAGAETSPWVLPASQVDGHVCLKSLAKQIGDRQRGEKPAMMNRSKLTQSLELPRGKWTPHDLRRSGATLMGNLGIRPDVIEKCLNHIQQNRLERIYQRQALKAEQAEAWQLLGARLELLTRTDTNNIVFFGRSAA